MPEAPAAPRLGELSEREVEVLRLVAQGLGDAEIAERWCSARTPCIGTWRTSARSWAAVADCCRARPRAGLSDEANGGRVGGRRPPACTNVARWIAVPLIDARVLSTVNVTLTPGPSVRVTFVHPWRPTQRS